MLKICGGRIRNVHDRQNGAVYDNAPISKCIQVGNACNPKTKQYAKNCAVLCYKNAIEPELLSSDCNSVFTKKWTALIRRAVQKISRA